MTSSAVRLSTFFLLCLALEASSAQQSFDQLWREASALSQRGEYAAAIAQLREAQRLKPQSYQVNLLLGEDLVRSGQAEESLQPLRAAASASSGDGEAEFWLGRAFAAARQFPSAIESYQSAVVRSPKVNEFWAALADFGLERFRQIGLQLQSTQSGVAIALRVSAGTAVSSDSKAALLEQSARAGPDQPGIWGELGAEQLRRGWKSAAAESLRIARAQQDGQSRTIELEAMMAASDGQWANAQRALRRLGQRSPSQLGMVLQAWPAQWMPPATVSGPVWDCLRGRFETCLPSAFDTEEQTSNREISLYSSESWDQLAKFPVSVENAGSWFRHGVAFAELKDCIRAIPALERGMDVDAHVASYWLQLCYASCGERAIAAIASSGRTGADTQALVHRLRADSLVRINGDLGSAVDEYNQAILAKPHDAALLERLAQAYFKLGEWQQARSAAGEALSLDARRPLLLRLLATISLNEREYPSALEYLKSLSQIDPKDGWTRVQMGIAYANTNQSGQAVEMLQPMLAAGYPDERGALHAILAGALRKLGRRQESLRAAAEADRLADSFARQETRSLDGPR
jgi:tetratricopeptide (TPR) repeat protein